MCPSKAYRADAALGTSLEILRDFLDVWPVAGRWYATLSQQAGINATRSVTELDSLGLTLDDQLGSYRQFDGTNPPELFRHLELAPHSQLAAANTLAQLSSAGAGFPISGAEQDLRVGEDDFAGLVALETGHPGGGAVGTLGHGGVDDRSKSVV